MIEYYTGVPGSGKTYRAVAYLYDIFLDSKSKIYGKFEKFYTNINEFDFDAFPKDKAHDLDFDDLYDKLDQLHKHYKKKATDSELIELAESLGVAHAFFVIDEAHNHFEKVNTVLVWWLSYHRHLHQDIILITQNLALVDAKYKTFSEFFYKAIPSSLRVFSSSLKYEQYVGSRMYKNQRSSKFSLKFNPDVYALYTSGANTQGKKVAHKYFYFIGGALVLSAFLLYLIVHYLFGGSDTKKPVPVSHKASVPVVSSDPDFPIVQFICNFDECQSDSIVVPLDTMSFYIKTYQLKVLTTDSLPNGYFIYRYRVPKKFIEEVIND